MDRERADKVAIVRRGLFAGAVAVVGSSATSQAQTQAPSGPPALDPRLQCLLDREEVRDVVTRYALSFDARDWAMQRSLFTDEIEMDFSASIGSGLQRMNADAWVAGVRPFFEGLPATQHIALVQSVDVDGDDAYARSLLHAQHYLPNKVGEPVQRMLGWYGNWLVRTKDGWRIRKMVQHIDWNEGNWWIFLKAAGKAG